MIKKIFLKALLPLFVTAAVAGGTVFMLTNKNNDTGKAAYSAWLSQGNSGSEAEFLSWVKDVANKKLDAGGDASKPDANTNTDKAPQAYETWLSEGNTGSETAFLDWIRQSSKRAEEPTTIAQQTRPNEQRPVVTSTAYNLWLSQGNSGSEAEFLNWIRVASHPSPPDEEPSQPTPSLYDSVKFESITATYDGTPHTITATGVPEHTEVNYVNNTATDIGVHRAFVRLYRADLGEKLLSATITIGKAQITGVSFKDVAFVYDGKAKNIKVSGQVPDGVNVAYAMNGSPFAGVTEAGTYTVTATLSGNNYETLTLAATLTINRAEITGITFGNQAFTYDGTLKNIAITGSLPAGTSVAYTDGSGNAFHGATVPAAYPVKATITGANYNTKVLEATLTINKADIKGVTFTDYSTLYDGTAKDIKVSGTLPAGVAVKYTLDSESGAEFTGATTVGVYNVVATLTGDYYNKLVLKAKLVIAAGQLNSVAWMKLTEAPTSAVFGNKTIILEWGAVTDAGSYDISLFYPDGKLATTVHVASGTSYDLRAGMWSLVVRGNYDVKMVALPKSGDPNYAPSDLSAPITYFHEGRLATPQNVRIENDYLKWDAVPGAQMYEIRAMQMSDSGQVVKSCSFNSDNLVGLSESMSDIKDFLKGSQCDMPSGKYRISLKASTTSQGFWVDTFASDSSLPTDEFDLVVAQSKALAGNFTELVRVSVKKMLKAL
ncbi:MAG: MBG domain-containing protein [Candidatus Nomurabacteria bacterium]|jgi:hypothetical protein|nr:MBG domain-containing protein [Candidatus Nomurabacteria bacterium]